MYFCYEVKQYEKPKVSLITSNLKTQAFERMHAKCYCCSFFPSSLSRHCARQTLNFLNMQIMFFLFSSSVFLPCFKAATQFSTHSVYMAKATIKSTLNLLFANCIYFMFSLFFHSLVPYSCESTSLFLYCGFLLIDGAVF